MILGPMLILMLKETYCAHFWAHNFSSDVFLASSQLHLDREYRHKLCKCLTW